MKKHRSALRGILAGTAGGLAAAWVMNTFVAGPGQTLQQAVQSDEENREQTDQSTEPKEDATMKAADAIAHAATGEHLSRAEKEKGGPVVHYAFGALAGGVYGGLAEYSGAVTSGFGTSFGGVLFSTADGLRYRPLTWAPPQQTSPPPHWPRLSPPTSSMESRRNWYDELCAPCCRSAHHTQFARNRFRVEQRNALPSMQTSTLHEAD